MYTHSKPLTVSEPTTGVGPVTNTKQVTITLPVVTDRFCPTALFPGALPDLHARKIFRRDDTITSDRELTHPWGWHAEFAVRVAKEQYQIARYAQGLNSQMAFVKKDILSCLIPYGANIGTGFKGYLGPIPYDATITGVELSSFSGGTCVVDVWVNATIPRSAADSIINVGGGATKPNLTGGRSYRDGTLTAWNTSLWEGDIIGFHLDASGGGLRDLTITLEVDVKDVPVVTQTKPMTISKSGTASKLLTYSKPLTVSEQLTVTGPILHSEPLTITRRPTVSEPMTQTAPPATMTKHLTISKPFTGTRPLTHTGMNTVTKMLSVSDPRTISEQVSIATAAWQVTVSKILTRGKP